MSQIPWIASENPVDAWPHVNVKDKVVLDLGCGFFGLTPTFRRGHMVWDDVKLPKIISTTEYWLNLGAKRVVGVDSNVDDIFCLTEQLGSDRALFICAKVTSARQVEEWITRYGVEAIKCDIEGKETVLLDMREDIFKSVSEYYIEAHEPQVSRNFGERFKKYGYTVRATMHHEAMAKWFPKDVASLIFAGR